MTDTLEVTSSAIRLIRAPGRRLTEVQSWPVAPGTDPVAAIASAPLPRPLGTVRVVMAHDEMLIRTMTQPACPPDRLDRIVRFELAAVDQEGGATVPSWSVLQVGGDPRILAMLTRTALIDRLRAALAAHGGKLAALTHPAIGLWHAFRAHEAGDIDAVLIDVGGRSTHIALVKAGELALVRTQSTGGEELVAAVADRRGMAPPDAARLVANLGDDPPEDLRELVRKQAQTLSVAINATVKLAKAQLQLDGFEPKRIFVAGSGAATRGFLALLAERTGMPVIPVNPFAALASAASAERMDELAALPTAYANAIGVASAERLELDAMAEERHVRRAFWLSDGLLRIAAGVAIAVILAAFAWQQTRRAEVDAAIAALDGPGGAVARAEAAQAAVAAKRAESADAAARVAVLARERAPIEALSACLAAVAAEQDPERCPVVITAVRVASEQGRMAVELEGVARSTGRVTTGDALKTLAAGIQSRVPAIARHEFRPRPIAPDRQPFHLVLDVAEAR